MTGFAQLNLKVTPKTKADFDAAFVASGMPTKKSFATSLVSLWSELQDDAKPTRGPGRPSKGLSAMTLKLTPHNRNRFTALLDDLVASGHACKTRDEAIGLIIDGYETGSAADPIGQTVARFYEAEE
tara:strand:- start:39 stop:419 length:381 start_codon:yes stop_codon:yes gene_type:complete